MVLGLNSHFLCFLFWQTRTGLKWGTAVGLPQRVFLRLFASHRQRTLKYAGATYPCRATFNTLYRLAPANLDVLHNLSSQMRGIAIPPYKRFCNGLRRCHAQLRERAVMLRLRKLNRLCSSTNTANKADKMGGQRVHAEEKQYSRPRFAAVAVLRFSPCPPSR